MRNELKIAAVTISIITAFSVAFAQSNHTEVINTTPISAITSVLTTQATQTTTTVETTAIPTTTVATTTTTAKPTTAKPTTTKKETVANSNADGYWITSEITAYTHTGNNTKSGVYPTVNHTIAMSSKYPMGTKVLINGIVYTKEDIGGAITGNDIDIFMDTEYECNQWGRRTLQVKVLY